MFAVLSATRLLVCRAASELPGHGSAGGCGSWAETSSAVQTRLPRRNGERVTIGRDPGDPPGLCSEVRVLKLDGSTPDSAWCKISPFYASVAQRARERSGSRWTQRRNPEVAGSSPAGGGSGSLAQLAERLAVNQEAAGSKPAGTANVYARRVDPGHGDESSPSAEGMRKAQNFLRISSTTASAAAFQAADAGSTPA